jgi:transposase
MDTSKHVFQLHGVNAAGVTVLRKKLRRKEMVAFFEKLAPTVIGIGTAWRLGVRAPRR